MRRALHMAATSALALSLACGENNGCGGDGPYEYPRLDPEAQVTPKATRMRITQAGFDTLARGVPGLVRASCEENPPDASAACAIDPTDSNRVLFYVSRDDPAQDADVEPNPVGFDVTLLGDGHLWAGSAISLELSSLANIDLTLLPVANGPDGIQITVGCNAPSFNQCTDPSEYARGSVDMTLEADLLGYQPSVCSVKDNSTAAYGIEIQSFRFIMYPRIELDVDNRPYLRVLEDDISVERMEIFFDIEVSRHPSCTSGECNMCSSAEWILEYILEPVIESGDFASMLATMIAEAIFGSFEDRPLDIEGQIRTQDLISVVNDDANPAGYRLAANTDTSPDVTGTTDLGLNIDFDAGFVATHNGCVSDMARPSWVLPDAPDPGTEVSAPDPDTGEFDDETFDFTLLVGDVFFGRALFELHDGGNFCLMLGAEEVAELTGGSFTPTVGGALELIAPGLITVAPPDAPVDLWIVPRFPATVVYGTGEGEGEDRDSHLQLVWPDLGVEMYPLVDDSYIRAVAFSFDLEIGISFEATPTDQLPPGTTAPGSLVVVIDRIELLDVMETYNEMNIAFNPSGFAELVSAFLSTLLSADPIDVALNADTIGFPFVPKLRAVKPMGAEGRFLGIFFRFCTPDDIDDSGNALCWEDPSGGNDIDAALGVDRVAGPGGDLPRDTMRVRAFSELDGLQLAYRVDGAGPYFSFRSADDDGLFTVKHPMLALGGEHEVTLVGRPRARPWQWTEATRVNVLSDHVAPVVSGERVDGGVSIDTWDDATDRIDVRVVVGDIDLGFATRDFVAAATDERVTLWARDGVGNLSQPFVVWPREPVAETLQSAPASTCAAVNGAWLLVLTVAVALRRRRR